MRWDDGGGGCHCHCHHQMMGGRHVVDSGGVGRWLWCGCCVIDAGGRWLGVVVVAVVVVVIAVNGGGGWDGGRGVVVSSSTVVVGRSCC